MCVPLYQSGPLCKVWDSRPRRPHQTRLSPQVSSLLRCSRDRGQKVHGKVSEACAALNTSSKAHAATPRRGYPPEAAWLHVPGRQFPPLVASTLSPQSWASCSELAALRKRNTDFQRQTALLTKQVASLQHRQLPLLRRLYRPPSPSPLATPTPSTRPGFLRRCSISDGSWGTSGFIADRFNSAT
ncbi:hypothetical protein HPB50_027285 [Hyalomma asiaticum]|uniref:Uncharacterized protein n=1 Tax=Hyalomma asiaticum TaxID=266040 RepID=A0ACB7T9T9_HYAAI|nr:hypothetical protein HPB50_027285 [Hyalomma asiaticum]